MISVLDKDREDPFENLCLPVMPHPHSCSWEVKMEEGETIYATLKFLEEELVKMCLVN